MSQVIARQYGHDQRLSAHFREGDEQDADLQGPSDSMPRIAPAQLSVPGHFGSLGSYAPLGVHAFPPRPGAHATDDPHAVDGESRFAPLDLPRQRWQERERDQKAFRKAEEFVTRRRDDRLFNELAIPWSDFAMEAIKDLLVGPAREDFRAKVEGILKQYKDALEAARLNHLSRKAFDPPREPQDYPRAAADSLLNPRRDR